MLTIDQKIVKILQVVTDFENKDEYSLPKELRDLRSTISYAHSFITIRLQDSYIKYAIFRGSEKTTEDFAEVALVTLQFQPFFDSVSFRQQLSICQEKKIISDLKVVQLFEKINKYRNDFSHPSAKKIQPYNDKNIQLEVLKNIVIGMGIASGILNGVFANQETITQLRKDLDSLLK